MAHGFHADASAAPALDHALRLTFESVQEVAFAITTRNVGVTSAASQDYRMTYRSDECALKRFDTLSTKPQLNAQEHIPPGESLTFFHSVTLPTVSLPDMAAMFKQHLALEDDLLWRTATLMQRVASNIDVSAHMVHRVFATCLLEVLSKAAHPDAAPERYAALFGMGLHEIPRLLDALANAVLGQLHDHAATCRSVNSFEDPLAVANISLECSV